MTPRINGWCSHKKRIQGDRRGTEQKARWSVERLWYDGSKPKQPRMAGHRQKPESCKQALEGFQRKLVWRILHFRISRTERIHFQCFCSLSCVDLSQKSWEKRDFDLSSTNWNHLSFLFLFLVNSLPYFVPGEKKCRLVTKGLNS